MGRASRVGPAGPPAGRIARGRTGALACAVTLALLTALEAVGETARCPSWSGEPSPLPTTSSSNGFLARFAALRAAQLLREASEVESVAPALADRLRLHARCFDPAAAPAEPVSVVSVHRPRVVSVRAPGGASDAGLDALDAPIRVARAAPVTPPVERRDAPAPPAAERREAPEAPPPPDWSRTDRALGSAESQLRGAEFEAALATAERLRRQLAASAAAPGAGERRARAEVVAATAEVALGQEEAARRSFERALAADPSLRLDPATTSPKVRRAFEAARGQAGAKP